MLDLTQKFKEEKYKKELEKKQQELEEALQEARQVRKLRELQVALKAVDDILDNIALLDNISSEDELNQVMPDLLAALGSILFLTGLISLHGHRRNVMCCV